MPRLAIIDQFVGAGGATEFLRGLIGGLAAVSGEAWDISLILKRHDSAGSPVLWTSDFRGLNVDVTFMYDSPGERLFYKLQRAPRVQGIYGSSTLLRTLPRLVRRLGIRSLRRLAGDDRLWIEDYCRQHRFDVVYFCYPFFLGSPRLESPMVATFHDFNWWRFRDIKPNEYQLVLRQTPGWLKACSHLIVSSEFIRNEVSAFYPEFESKARVIRVGIPGQGTEATPEELERYRSQKGLPANFVLTVGWIGPHKNQKVLVEAIGRLARGGRPIPLVLVGPNSAELQPGCARQIAGYVKEVNDACNEYGLVYGRDYWALGYVDDMELEFLYRLATALVMPTLYEAGSFPVREAMRAGCPVICSRISALVEEVELVGGNAWLFDPHDPSGLAAAINTVIDNPVAARQKTDRAAQLVTNIFSWKATAEGYLSVFEEAIQ